MIIPCLLFAWGVNDAYEQVSKVKDEVQRGGIVEKIKACVRFVENTCDYDKRVNPISVQGYYFMCRVSINNLDEFMQKMSPVVKDMGEIEQNIDSVMILLRDAFRQL